MEKVLIGTPVLLIGGTEIHTVNLAEVLIHAGYQITICCYYDYDDFIVSKFEAIGANVILMNLNRSDSILRLMGKLRRVFLKIKPDIVHVQYIAPGLIPIMAAKFAGIRKVFATVHQPGRIYGLKAKLLIRVAAYICDAFFCNSKSVEESWFGDSQVFYPNEIHSKRKNFTIYNGIDIEKIEKIGKELNRDKIKDLLGIKDKRVIGVVGRLRKEKGQATLLESMKTIIQELPDAVLIVVGDGPDRPYLQEMAKKLGIGLHVKWLKRKGHDEVLGLYNIMDVVVVPSLFEGFGLAAAEAMAAGLPVVGSRVDGLSEIIEHKVAGYLVPAGDCDELAKTTIQLLSNPENSKKMGEKGKERVQELFSMEHFVQSVVSAYQYFSKRK
jgi:glycosyltransferase involved in cell wall biosynthesis